MAVMEVTVKWRPLKVSSTNELSMWLGIEGS